LKYCDQLKACKLTSLHYRRLRGDIIETYKIVTGKYDPVLAPTLSRSVSYITRGNNLRLQKHRTRYDLRKYYFNNRVVNLWNSLPYRVVMSDNTNIFKNRLDSFWEGQDIIFDFRAQLYGTGSRSEIRIDY